MERAARVCLAFKWITNVVEGGRVVERRANGVESPDTGAGVAPMKGVPEGSRPARASPESQMFCSGLLILVKFIGSGMGWAPPGQNQRGPSVRRHRPRSRQIAPEPPP